MEVAAAVVAAGVRRSGIIGGVVNVVVVVESHEVGKVVVIHSR